jgi:hypothetical protein
LPAVFALARRKVEALKAVVLGTITGVRVIAGGWDVESAEEK